MNDVVNSAAVTSRPDDLIALYDETIDDVHRYASRLTGGDRARTEDLVQETYLGVLRRLRAGEALTINAGYLVVACRSRFLDELKADRRRVARELRVVPSPTVDDTSLPPLATERLAELPDDQRVALILRYVDDLPVATVARHLDRSVAATESLLARARTALRHLLQEDDR